MRDSMLLQVLQEPSDSAAASAVLERPMCASSTATAATEPAVRTTACSLHAHAVAVAGSYLLQHAFALSSCTT